MYVKASRAARRSARTARTLGWVAMILGFGTLGYGLAWFLTNPVSPAVVAVAIGAVVGVGGVAWAWRAYDFDAEANRLAEVEEAWRNSWH